MEPHLIFCVSEQVLIIGGGDGGVLREVVKHPMVESVVQCEIDEVCIRFPAARSERDADVKADLFHFQFSNLGFVFLFFLRCVLNRMS